MQVALVKVTHSIPEHSIAKKFECLNDFIYQIYVFA